MASALTYVEVSSSVAMAGRVGRLGRRALGRAFAELDVFWADVTALDLDAQLGSAAARLARRHALSGADSVHLATAMATGAVLATWDRRLFLAAEAEGIAAVGYG